MTILSLLEFSIRPDRLADADAVMAEVLAATRAFDGCERLEVRRDLEDPAHIVVLEFWTSVEHDDAYRAWRATPEGVSTLREILADPPRLTRLAATAI
jgi:quinol monooxygenase YgiN